MPRNPASLQLSDTFHDRLLAVRDRASIIATARLDAADVIEDGLAEAGLVITAGQQAAVDLAMGYLLSLARLEVGDDVDLAPQLEANVGHSGDGRTLDAVLGATGARFHADEREMPQKYAYARASLQRVAAYEVMDAGARELAHQTDAAEGVRGWRVKSRGTCGACLAMDSGKVLSGGVVPPFHPHCSCIVEPVFDVPERVQRPTGSDRFDALTPAKQNAALGPEKAALVRAGDVSLADLVTVQTFRDWTPVITETPLEDLIAVAGITVLDS